MEARRRRGRRCRKRPSRRASSLGAALRRAPAAARASAHLAEVGAPERHPDAAGLGAPDEAAGLLGVDELVAGAPPAPARRQSRRLGRRRLPRAPQEEELVDGGIVVLPLVLLKGARVRFLAGGVRDDCFLAHLAVLERRPEPFERCAVEARCRT